MSSKHRPPTTLLAGRATSAGALLLSIIASLGGDASAQEVPVHAGALAHALDRLAITARVLYVAAHPDDENTRLLAHLANGRHLGVAYLSMTRGGGGQNLIGREQDELLDVVRTEELLAARRLDGAEQRFTTMRDFGYSKSTAETLEIWEHDRALADVVWVIRTFQPDVIITRFDPNPPNHGHHTASAVLARQAFDAAADPARFPEQLALGAKTWKAERLLHNIPSWREAPPAEVKAGEVRIDVGGFDPRLGLSFGELAASSRSQHKSQGFGVPGERGPLVERFVLVAGSAPGRELLDTATGAPSTPLGWERFGAPGVAVARHLSNARAALARDEPERALPALAEAHAALDALPPVPRVTEARARLVRVAAACAGLFVRATAGRPGVVAGGSVPIEVEVVLGRPAAVRLERLLLEGATVEEGGADVIPVGAQLVPNEKKKLAAVVRVPAGAPVTAPYWLAERPLPGRQVVREPALVGRADSPAAVRVRAELKVEGRLMSLEVPVLYGWTDNVQGERLRGLLVIPS